MSILDDKKYITDEALIQMAEQEIKNIYEEADVKITEVINKIQSISPGISTSSLSPSISTLQAWAFDAKSDVRKQIKMFLND